MTIERVMTLSRNQAAGILLDGMPIPSDMQGPEPAWIGFETPDSGYESPLRLVEIAPAMIVPMADVEVAEGNGPTLLRARAIVAFVHDLMDSPIKYALFVHCDLMDSPIKYALFVHCRAGMYRSGAVAQWLREDYDIPESRASNRLHVLGDTRNRRLLELLRKADDRRRS